MVINPFGICLVGLVCFLFIKCKSAIPIFKGLMILTAVCSLNIRMGYFIKVGESVISYSSILMYLTTVIAIYLILLHKKVPKKIFFAVLIMWLALGIGLIRNIVTPYSEHVITGNWTDYVLGKNVESLLSENSFQIGYYLILVCSGIILMCSYTYFSQKDFREILSTVIKYSKIAIVLGIIEFVLENLLKTQFITNMCIAFFGSYGSQHNLLISRGGFFTVQGTTKEASMYTTVIFYIAVMLIIDFALSDRKHSTNKKWLMLCMCLLVFNPAISSIVYLCIIGLMLFVHRHLIGLKKANTVRLGRITTIVVFITFVVYIIITNQKNFLESNNYILHRVGLAIEQLKIIVSGTGTLMYSSEAIRFSGIVYDLKLFMQRPFFGFGLGSVSCNSGIVTFLVNAGMVGILAWYYLLHKFMGNQNTINEHIFVFEIIILPSLLLNDYETILCIIIPIIIKNFTYLRENQCRKVVGKDIAYEETISNSSHIDVQKI